MILFWMRRIGIMIPELRILSKDIPTLMWHATVPVNLSGYICTC